jgi:hypothetical protein
MTSAAMLDGDRSKQIVGEQMLLMLDRAYSPVPAYTEGQIVFGGFSTFKWDLIRKDLARLRVQWDEVNCTYTAVPNGNATTKEGGRTSR